MADLSCSGNNICIDCDFFNDSRKSIPSVELTDSSCKMTHSLALIKPLELKIEKFNRSRWGAGTQIKAPFYKRNNNLNEYGFYVLDTDEVYLTISLGEIYERDQSHYKFNIVLDIYSCWNY